MKPYLLVITADPEVLAQLRAGLAANYEIATANDRAAALDAFRATRPLAIILDLQPAAAGSDTSESLGTLSDLLITDPQAQVIGLYSGTDREIARQAALAGASDFVRKPLALDELRLVLRRCVHVTRLERELRESRVRGPHEVAEGLLGSCPAMQKVFETVRKVATTDAPVLIIGEAGTGKEAVARAIHQRSLRSGGPFVTLNCSATPQPLIDVELFGAVRTPGGQGATRKGRIELAQGGTLLLDDIGGLPLPLQMQILRLLQEQVIERTGVRHTVSVDCRVLAATPAPLDVALNSGRFRKDLYYRLAVVQITVPPLRERGEDVVLLANHFLHRFTAMNGRPQPALNADAVQALRAHSWPGNVRELQGRIRRAAIMCDGREITPEDLNLGPVDAAVSLGGGPLRAARARVEREMVRQALLRHGGNISAAATELGVSRPTLYELMQKLGISRAPSGTSLVEPPRS